MRNLLHFLLCFFIIPTAVLAQDSIIYTTEQAHSHNDYEQTIPFWQAYYQQFGSIEADIFLRNDSLYVAHTVEDISPDRTLYSLFLKPIATQEKKNKGSIYADPKRTLQLLIDLKTSSRETMTALVRELSGYSKLLAPTGTVKVVISGNVPNPDEFDQYPEFIYFDGRPGITYSTEQLKRIGLISQSFTNYSKWKGKGMLIDQDHKAVTAVIKEVHDKGKRIRFWATPDTPNAWKILMGMGVDYVNTDKVIELGSYLRNRPKATYTFPVPYTPYRPTYRNNDSKGKVKNIILLIGDGMGLAQIYAGMTANRGQLNLAKFLNIGFSKTNSADSYITDSAAGGTAMATGQKTRNRAVGVDSLGKPLESLPTTLRKRGIKSGIIAAGSVVDATPATFYAHQSDRDFYKQIAHDFLKNPADVLIGGGYEFFEKEKITDTLRSMGYQISREWSELKNMRVPFAMLDTRETVSKLKGRKDFLIEAFRKTCESLQGNKAGFFVMAEGTQIDNGGHANVMPFVVTEMLDFDRLVGEALRFADSNGETLVIVTADHETGGLTLLDGDLRKGFVDGHFSTNDHSAVPVPVFAYGPRSLDFRGTYENTEIYSKILEVLKIRK
jgi:alkaline phosphatase